MSSSSDTSRLGGLKETHGNTSLVPSRSNTFLIASPGMSAPLTWKAQKGESKISQKTPMLCVCERACRFGTKVLVLIVVCISKGVKYEPGRTAILRLFRCQMYTRLCSLYAKACCLPASQSSDLSEGRLSSSPSSLCPSFLCRQMKVFLDSLQAAQTCHQTSKSFFRYDRPHRWHVVQGSTLLQWKTTHPVTSIAFPAVRTVVHVQMPS